MLLQPYLGPLSVVLLTLILLMPAPPANPLLWDALNGVGLAALLLLLCCALAAPASQSGYSANSLRLHIGIAVVIVLAIAVHAVGLLLSNAVVIEYLKWRAPWYMHAGNVAFVLLIVLSVISVARVRRRLHQSFHSFRALHRGLSALALGLCVWHVLGSGYLARQPWQVVLIAVATAGWTAVWWWQPARPRWPLAANAQAVPLWVSASVLALLLATCVYIVLLR